MQVEKIVEAAPYLIDRRVGVVKSVREYQPEPGDPPLFCFSAASCNTETFTSQKNFGETGGISLRRELALAKALGEAVERYCSAIYKKEAFPLFSKKEAPFSCASPHMWDIHDSKQYLDPRFPFVPFQDDTLIRWVPAYELTTKTIQHIPAQTVYIPYYAFQKDGPEQLIGQVISTGLACHHSFEKAALSAICEVIERDAFMITWQAGLSPSRIVETSLPASNRHLLEKLKNPASQIDIFNITLDSQVPTILSTLRSHKPKAPALVAAAAADLNPEEAIRKSLEELAHTRRYSQYLMSLIPELENDPSYENIIKQVHHLRFWSNHKNLPLASFLFESNKTVDFSSLLNLDTGNPHKNVDVVVKKVAQTRHPVFLVDITSPDIKPLGLFVIRAVIPGYQPLRMGHIYRALGGKRLKEIPQKFGYKNTQKDGLHVPHPFP